MSDLIVITYDTEQAGLDALVEVQRLQKMQLLALEDAAVAVKNKKGKVKVKQTLESMNTGAATSWGLFWGLLIGLLFLAPIFFGLFGALMGLIAGKSSDLGIDNKFIKEVGDSLDPGNAALFMLVISATEDKVIEELSKTGGHLFQTSLSQEDEDKLRQALEHDQVKASANEMVHDDVQV
jgi:uncharacterized membrane protein